jgi:hypothetical protein
MLKRAREVPVPTGSGPRRTLRWRAAMLASLSVIAAGVVVAVAVRRGEQATATTEPAAHPAAGTLRVLPSGLPAGYHITSATIEPRGDKISTPVPYHIQYFRRPGQLGTPPSAQVKFLNRADLGGSESALRKGDPIDAGPWKVYASAAGEQLQGGAFADGDREVIVTVYGGDRAILLALAGALRWDAAAARYAAAAAGLVEVAHVLAAVGEAPTEQGRVVLTTPAGGRVDVVTKLGGLWDNIEETATQQQQLSGAQVSAEDVGGRTVLRTTFSGLTILTVPWADGVTTVEVTRDDRERVGEDELRAIAASLAAVDQTTWDAAVR